MVIIELYVHMYVTFTMVIYNHTADTDPRYHASIRLYLDISYGRDVPCVFILISLRGDSPWLAPPQISSSYSTVNVCSRSMQNSSPPPLSLSLFLILSLSSLSLSLYLSLSFPHFFPSIPTITEEVARRALYDDVYDHCCYGTGAADDLVITNIQSSSAFHVSIL